MPQLAGLTVLRAGSQVSSGCVQRQITPQAAHASASLGQSAAWGARWPRPYTGLAFDIASDQLQPSPSRSSLVRVSSA